MKGFWFDLAMAALSAAIAFFAFHAIPDAYPGLRKGLVMIAFAGTLFFIVRVQLRIIKRIKKKDAPTAE